MLEEACGFDLIEADDGDGELTFLSDSFQLDIALTNHILVVKAIKVYEKRNGIGRALIDGVHEFCRTHWLTPIAQNVKKTDEAMGFWSAMGYSPDPSGSRNYYHEGLFSEAA